MIREYIIKVDDTKTDIMGSTPLEEQPKELVRCKGCKYHSDQQIFEYKFCMRWKNQIKNFATSDDWFCADAERKEGDGE